MPDETEPRGASELQPEQVPATEQVPQPPEGGAVGPETQADIGQSERPLPRAEDIVAEVTAGLSEEDKAQILPLVEEVSGRALNASQRLWQSRETKKFQELAEARRDLEAAQARLDERRQMPVAAPTQPGQDPAASLDAQIEQAIEAGDVKQAIALSQRKENLPMVFAMTKIFERVQASDQELADWKQKQAERGLETDSRWAQHADRARAKYQEYEGRVPMSECLDIVSAGGLRAENAALHSGQRSEAAAHVAQVAANVVTGSAPAGGEVALPPRDQPKDIDEGIDQWLEDIGGEDNTKILATRPRRTPANAGAPEAVNPPAADREGIIARLRTRGQ